MYIEQAFVKQKRKWDIKGSGPIILRIVLQHQHCSVAIATVLEDSEDKSPLIGMLYYVVPVRSPKH